MRTFTFGGSFVDPRMAINEESVPKLAPNHACKGEKGRKK